MYDHDLGLDDLLSDPLVRLVMASDGVEEAHIRQLAQRIGRHERTKPPARRLWSEASRLRHTPSCRGTWRAASMTQPSA